MTAEQRDKLAEQFEKASRVAGAEPIAVVGIGCRLPGGVTGPTSYWELLQSGTDAITEVPADRWDGRRVLRPGPDGAGPDVDEVGRLTSSDVAGFDADFFGISPREAAAMDPQQRLLLEVAWEALEHAGLGTGPPRREPHRRDDGRLLHRVPEHPRRRDPDTIDAYSATGNAHSVAVGPDLLPAGPATARPSRWTPRARRRWSSIHLACQSLRDAGERPRAGRRRQPDPAPGDPARACQVGHAVAARPCHAFDAARRRLRPRRGLRRRGAQAARPTRCATAIGCWRWCAARRSTRTAAPTA